MNRKKMNPKCNCKFHPCHHDDEAADKIFDQGWLIAANGVTTFSTSGTVTGSNITWSTPQTPKMTKEELKVLIKEALRELEQEKLQKNRKNHVKKTK